MLVSIITFFGPCVNIASTFLEPRSLIPEPVNRQSPKELGRGVSFSMENSRKSECVCGDGQTYSQRRREEERIRSENRHKHEVFREMVVSRGENGFRRANKKEKGLESGANGTKEGNREVQKNGDLDLVGNMSKLHGKKKRDEDRIVNGYDVSGLARPWHASLVDTTTQ